MTELRHIRSKSTFLEKGAHSIHTFAFLVTVVPFEDDVVFVTFLAVHVGGGCTAPAFTLVDVWADCKYFY